MNEQELSRLRNHLLIKRKEIFDRVRGLESGLQELQEPQIELEEMAQKAERADFFNKLGSRERGEIEAIELALRKIDGGKYGLCEECGQSIQVKRLQAIPWARLCRQDAEEYEKTGQVLMDARDVDLAELPDTKPK
jgi:DnaK suppressor protein